MRRLQCTGVVISCKLPSGVVLSSACFSLMRNVALKPERIESLLVQSGKMSVYSINSEPSRYY